ncbi:solute carrier family 2, facilitated glucose transporter member 11 isoform X2 [Vulpes lagopus]|uniref:solute carrier family 2, facilitated glucose transporter member 11 isoform X2 n=1 Tax=Vulpes lagopus TaxID=494514 RepID=UPI001BCA3795|nr:solute carrier family 2, facilitated glucose transporter member 11 isoform X2 [Vulpes lagopus]
MPTLQRLMQGRVLLLTICAAGIGGTFQFGYNLSIINAPTLHIQEFINETWRVRTGQPLPRHLVLLVWSLIVSLYPLGGLFGALLAGPLAVMLGRKKSLLVNNIFVVAAASLFGFSRRAGSFEMVILGRLLIGVSAGVSMSVQPMYLGESAPKELRGAVAMTPAIFTALGIVMGQVVGLSVLRHCSLELRNLCVEILSTPIWLIRKTQNREVLGDPWAWPLLLASCLVPGVLQLASLPLLPESPRYLLIDCGDTEACLAALQRLRGTDDVAQELSELDEERAACRGQRARRPWELLHDRGLRRQVTSLAVLGGALELCGNDSVSPASPPRAAAERRQPQPGPPLRPPFPGVRSRLLGVPGGWRPRRGGPVRRRGHRELRAAGGLRVVCADRKGGPPRAADSRLLPDDLLGKYLHRGPVPAELRPLDALPGHVLHLCLHPQLWHWPRRACPTFSMCLSLVSVSVGPSILPSSSPRPKARASWRSPRNWTDSASLSRTRALTGRAQKSSCPQSCSSVGMVGAQSQLLLSPLLPAEGPGPLHSLILAFICLMSAY